MVVVDSAWFKGVYNVWRFAPWSLNYVSGCNKEVLSAVKAYLTSLGTRPSASQLVACTVTSLPYKPYTSHGKKPHCHSFELASSSKCHPELLHSWFHSNSGEKLKLAIDVDDLSDGLWIAAIASELHAEDCAVDMPKVKFSANKILAEGFFNNPPDDIVDHHSAHSFS